VILARSGEGRNLLRKGEVLIKDKAKVASGVGAQHTSVQWRLVCFSCTFTCHLSVFGLSVTLAFLEASSGWIFSHTSITITMINWTFTEIMLLYHSESTQSGNCSSCDNYWYAHNASWLVGKWVDFCCWRVNQSTSWPVCDMTCYPTQHDNTWRHWASGSLTDSWCVNMCKLQLAFAHLCSTQWDCFKPMCPYVMEIVWLLSCNIFSPDPSPGSTVIP